MDRAAYDALNALNWSRLKLIEQSPLHFLKAIGAESSSFKLGTAAHMAVLEPDRFLRNYEVTKIRRDKRTKAWQKAEADALKRGVELLSKSEWEDTVEIQKAIRGHVPSMKYLSEGESEVGLTWTLKGDGFSFDCKGRADWVGSALIDLKTTECSAPESFKWSAKRYGYFGQVAWYHDGLFLSRGVDLPVRIIAVDNGRPYIPTVFRIRPEELEFGRNQYLELLAKLDRCQSSNTWGGYVEADEVDLELTT